MKFIKIRLQKLNVKIKANGRISRRVYRLLQKCKVSLFSTERVDRSHLEKK